MLTFSLFFRLSEDAISLVLAEGENRLGGRSLTQPHPLPRPQQVGTGDLAGLLRSGVE